MGEVAWVRKYRPTSFDDYLGDEIKTQIINRFKDRKNIPNTIMLYGTRGTGKTSMARLMCKEIQCLNPVDGHSCGECEMCQAIDEYISHTEAGVDCEGIIEVDAATTTGKDSINDIMEDALVPPLYPAKYKIVIMDECHQLSTAAQNSLLKIVEEPPEHLIFILCTTDPEKVLGTIKSRIQLMLEVKKKTVAEMVAKLHSIADAEGLTISDQALEIIAKKGERIPRECIMKLESIAKASNGSVTLEDVKRQLGDVETAIYIEFYEASFKSIANKDTASILRFVKKLQEKNIQAKDFIRGLTRFTLDCIYIKCGIDLNDYPTDSLTKAKKLFTMFNSSACDMLLLTVQNAYSNIGEDDTKNELVIINTALRIGKAAQLSKISTLDRLIENVTQMCIYNMQNQKSIAQDENIESVKRYQTILANANKDALEKMPETDIKKEGFAEMFNGIEDVKGGESILNNTTENNSDDNSTMKRLKDIFGL